MEPPVTEKLQQALPEDTGGPRPGVTSRWMVRGFPWHLRLFLMANVGLNIVNAFTGLHWWAFWPLVATGFVLAVHYLFYKAAAVDERWVEERVEELNLKSYDRSHIEDLKTRHSGENIPGDRGS